MTAVLPARSSGLLLLLASLCAAVPGAAAAPGSLRLLTGPAAKVTAVTYSPDGKSLAVASADHLIRIYDVDSRSIQRAWPTDGTTSARTLLWSPDGHQLTAAIEGGPLVAWTAEGAPVWTLKLPVHVSAVSLAPSVGGKVLAAGLTDGSLRLIDARTGKITKTIRASKAPILSVALSADGVFLVAADGTSARIWNAKTGAFLRPTKSGVSNTEFVSVALSPDSRVVGAGTRTGQMHFWTIIDGVEVGHLEAHSGAVRSLAWSASGDRVLTSSADKTARVWNWTNGERLQDLGAHTEGVTCAAFRPDGKQIASGGEDNAVFLWSTDSDKPLQKLVGARGLPTSLGLVPQTTNLVVFTDVGVLESFDLANGVLKWERFGHTPPARAMVVTPDGRYVVTAGGLQVTPPGDDADEGGQPVAVSASRGDLKIWESGGMPLRDLGGHGGAVTAMAVSGDGRVLVTVAESDGHGDVLVWDLANAATRLRVGGEVAPVRAVAFAGNGRVFATGGADGVARLLDPQNGAVVRSIEVGGEIDAVALSQDGSILVTGGQNEAGSAPVQLWDTNTGKLVRTLSGHPGRITSLTFSVDGWYLVSTSSGGRTPLGDARLWLTQTGELAATAVAEPGVGFVSAAFAPDAHTIALGATDLSIRLWSAAK